MPLCQHSITTYSICASFSETRVSRGTFDAMMFPSFGSGRRNLGNILGSGTTSEIYLYLNIIGVSYFLFTIVVIFYTSVYIYLPTVYEQYVWLIDTRTYIAYFLLFEVLINYLFLISHRSYYSPKASATLPSNSWARCLDCQTPRPPKTHHCVSCKRCILKRDHHCFLSATCIGFSNQRYFIVYCFYCALGCSYCVFLCWQYCTLMFGNPLTRDNWYHYLLPVAAVEWLLGYQPLALLLHVSLLFLALTAAFSACGMGVVQFLFGLLGVTQHEYSHGVVPDRSNVNVKKNLYSTFGHWFILNFFIPMPCLKQHGDGTT